MCCTPFRTTSSFLKEVPRSLPCRVGGGPAVEGMIVGSGISRDSKRCVSAVLDETGPSVGDKWATPHGQNFVICCILPEKEMPLCTCGESGVQFRPHMILSSSYIFNRTTFGQRYEGFKAAMAVDLSSYDPKDPGEGLLCDPGIPDSYDKWRDSMCQTVRVNYGVCRFWLLAHLVRDKQYYMSKVPRSLRPPGGRLSGAGVRLGEMELQALLTKGHKSCTRELLDKGDMVIL
ncbi:unnamed protein product [Discosporangium mesarthrocarpum]